MPHCCARIDQCLCLLFITTTTTISLFCSAHTVVLLLTIQAAPLLLAHNQPSTVQWVKGAALNSLCLGLCSWRRSISAQWPRPTVFLRCHYIRAMHSMFKTFKFQQESQPKFKPMGFPPIMRYHNLWVMGPKSPPTKRKGHGYKGLSGYGLYPPWVTVSEVRLYRQSISDQG